MELEEGILRIERRNAGQGQQLRTWMEPHLLPEFAAYATGRLGRGPEVRAAAGAGPTG